MLGMELTNLHLLLYFPSSSMVCSLLLFLASLSVMEYILPAKLIPGTLLPDKSRQYYKCNGLYSLILLLAILGICAKCGIFSFMIVAEKIGELFTAALIFCFMFSLIMYVTGCKSAGRSASLKPEVTGNFLHDWWFGVQLNPQFLHIDLKFFSIKAGMMGWLFLNFAIAAKQLKDDGTLKLSMILYEVFAMVYILDFFWFEAYMTSTWDIIAERFGFMLIFGDLVWIPFTFSIQGWWLLRHTVELTKLAAALNVVIFIIGYAVFRGANMQKHIFKNNPSAPIWGCTPKVIGGKLLASGYWGVARHCNYLGDILLAFSFSLPCGASSIVPYFYPTYLVLLLLWREKRDDTRCREKYKEDWLEYCKVVPWRIFPYIY
eukprot:c26310_g1_i1 orf=442-1566(+)